MLYPHISQHPTAGLTQGCLAKRPACLAWVGVFTCLQHTDWLHWCRCDLWNRPRARTSSLQIPHCRLHQTALQNSYSPAFDVFPSSPISPRTALSSISTPNGLCCSFWSYIGDFYTAWVFCRNHLLWWCWLLVIFNWFSFFFSQYKKSLWGVYKINNYWREVRPKGSLLHKKYFKFLDYIYFQYPRKEWWMIEKALSRIGGKLPWWKNIFSCMVKVREAFGIYSK